MDTIARIGLTGGIGSGKSTLARLLVAQGAGLVDSDAISHELTGAGGGAIDAIRAAFGAEFIGRDGALDRARMRALVFADPGRRRQLEALLHPLIGRRGEQIAQAAAPTSRYLVFDVPLLAEAGGADADRRFDRVLVVDCPVQLQVARVLKRGLLRREEIEAILAGQAGREQRLAIADDVVFNAGDMVQLERCARRLHAAYSALGRAPVAV